MRIGILGTRGIPNHYGGFEQCAEFLAAGLVAKGHDVYVYCSSTHPYQLPRWNGVRLVRCYDPEPRIGTAGQFIYDLNCILHARRRRFDVCLHLGYTSASVWRKLWPKQSVNIVNMDGLEWARSKYSRHVQRFLKKAERWAAERGDVLIADSTGIAAHLREAYGKDSIFIPYGAELPVNLDSAVPAGYGLRPGKYCMLMARMEPENNIAAILEGHAKSRTTLPMLIIGNTGNGYGQKLLQDYPAAPQRLYAGAVYDAEILNSLRHFSSLYFHGHSVGGTNPSLLEAMACGALICAHDNIFNRAVLGSDALYFKDSDGVRNAVEAIPATDGRHFRKANYEKIRRQYNWPAVVNAYEAAMHAAVKRTLSI